MESYDFLLSLFRLEHDYEVVDGEEPPELPDPSDQNLAQGLDELSIDRPEMGEEAKEREHYQKPSSSLVAPWSQKQGKDHRRDLKKIQFCFRFPLQTQSALPAVSN